MDVRLTTRYTDEGYRASVPRGLIAEMSGNAASFDEALASFGQAANLLSPVICLATNASVPAFRHELAYDDSQGAERHAFKQWFYEESLEFPRPGRMIAFEALAEILDLYLRHVAGPRIHRASVQYQEALASWRPGEELRAVMHLWMAVEALTKPFLERELAASHLTVDELCGHWGIEKKRLDSEVRRRVIFQGDSGAYRQALDVSDGLEHMFRDFPALHHDAAAVRNRAARYVRHAILDLLGLSSPTLATLETAPYDEPLSLLAGVFSVAGEMTGPAGRLAREGLPHPFLSGTVHVREIEPRDGTSLELTMETNLTLSAGPGVSLLPGGLGTEIPLNSLETTVTRSSDAASEGDVGNASGATNA